MAGENPGNSSKSLAVNNLENKDPPGLTFFPPLGISSDFEGV